MLRMLHDTSTTPALGEISDRDALVDVLAQTAFTVTGLLTRVGAEHDLSLTQLRVIGILRDRRLRMSELADHLGLEKSTMSGLVDRAARRGLLCRAPSVHDGRSIEVFLTDRGTAIAGRILADVRLTLAPLTVALSLADQRRLHGLLAATLSSSDG